MCFCVNNFKVNYTESLFIFTYYFFVIFPNVSVVFIHFFSVAYWVKKVEEVGLNNETPGFLSALWRIIDLL